jgi:arsenate reductase
MEKPRVLFLCTGNSARSLMAEALLRHHAGNSFEVHSAGLQPKGINPYTARVLKEINVSVDSLWSKGVREYMGTTVFTYVITVCDHAEENCPTIFLTQGHHLHWSFEDPAAFDGPDEEKAARFRAIRDQIQAQIVDWLAGVQTPQS